MLLIAHDLQRSASLSQEVRRLLPTAHVEADADPLDGLLKAARMPADLVILDAALSAGGAPALSRHLARVVPGATVLVFDDLAQDGPPPPAHCRPWSDLPPSLLHWMRAFVPADGR